MLKLYQIKSLKVINIYKLAINFIGKRKNDFFSQNF